ncbi:MAG TPA: hypothetical protein VGN82_08445 [Bosea sp. (in: a-proteobacteria)]|jgi:hypothetical protein|nr:hypothetical protein [Bosea sp. (in: a-proteobacteria)]
MPARFDYRYAGPAPQGEIARLRRSLIRLQDEARLLRRDPQCARSAEHWT